MNRVKKLIDLLQDLDIEIAADVMEAATNTTEEVVEKSADLIDLLNPFQ